MLKEVTKRVKLVRTRGGAPSPTPAADGQTDMVVSVLVNQARVVKRLGDKARAVRAEVKRAVRATEAAEEARQAAERAARGPARLPLSLRRAISAPEAPLSPSSRAEKAPPMPRRRRLVSSVARQESLPDSESESPPRRLAPAARAAAVRHALMQRLWPGARADVLTKSEWTSPAVATFTSPSSRSAAAARTAATSAGQQLRRPPPLLRGASRFDSITVSAAPEITVDERGDASRRPKRETPPTPTAPAAHAPLLRSHSSGSKLKVRRVVREGSPGYLGVPCVTSSLPCWLVLTACDRRLVLWLADNRQRDVAAGQAPSAAQGQHRGAC